MILRMITVSVEVRHIRRTEYRRNLGAIDGADKTQRNHGVTTTSAAPGARAGEGAAGFASANRRGDCYGSETQGSGRNGETIAVGGSITIPQLSGGDVQVNDNSVCFTLRTRRRTIARVMMY